MVTALDGDRPHGTTVSAFASHSLTPPMVLVSLDNRSQLLALIRRTGQRFDGVRQPLVQGGTHLADCRSCRPPREGAGCGMARLLGPIRPLSPEDLERSEAIRRRPAPGRGAGHGPVLACSPP
ncbi:flavin reductase [Streptomyces sp. NBC_00258]|uniref:flavin reductase n=1 Tax=Streptomyces sp. NBC_00258 TaxID=2903642 RepID=UPI002E2D7F03|nr:flavin reductase [Streptomyces sp. NBC_00258]